MSKSIQLKPRTVGTMELTGLVDISDPSYDRDVWCRLNDVKVDPGKYEVAAYVGTHRYTFHFDGKTERQRDTRVYILQIRKHDHIVNPDEMELVGEIGVDAGLAGFFPSPKKNFTREEWREFCDRTLHHKQQRPFYAVLAEGACSASGMGDGVYEVYAEKNERGECVSIEIRF